MFNQPVCVCFNSKLVPAGSEEDLDEEGLGRRAVTAQVAASVRGFSVLSSAPHFMLPDDFLLSFSLLSPLHPGEGIRPTGSRGHVCGGADPRPGGQLEI